MLRVNISSIRSSWTHFNEILIQIQTFLAEEMDPKIANILAKGQLLNSAAMEKMVSKSRMINLNAISRMKIS